MADVKKYYLFVLGCQMNQADAERMAAVLNDLGCQKTADENQADLIVVVACSVRQSAVDRIYGKIKLWQNIKKERLLTTILTGCILLSDKQKMARFFDYVIDINNIADLKRILDSDEWRINSPLPNQCYFNIKPQYQSSFSAYVPISTGCNNYCSYCVVPYVRGQEKSRPAQEIVDECQKLIKRGYKEIILIGQNVNNYGQDLPDEIKFSDLLKIINGLPGNFWLRFITSHPKDMSDELLKVVAEGEKICKYIHLPVQSGDNEILQKMNRKYTREHYLNLIQKIRQMIPNAAISTDVIVGFPGETKQQFKNTVKLCKEAKFDMAYLAQYSPRLGTAAYQLNDDVPKKEKERRENVLNKVLSKTALKANKKRVGKIVEVLIEKVKTHDSKPTTFNLIGKTRTFKTAKVLAASLAGGYMSPAVSITDGLTTNRVADGPAVGYVGQFIKVKITKARNFGLEGILVKSS